MFSLVRTRFIDERWGVEELDDAAELWLRCYELLHGESGFTRTPDRTLTVILRGFARSAAANLVLDLKARLRGSELALTHIEQPDADAISIATLPRPSNHAPPRGLGLPLLADLCEGQWIELRFTLSGRAGKLFGLVGFSSTLVIHGVMRGGELIAKSVWRTGAGGWEDHAYRFEPSVEGGRFLQALAAYRESQAMPTKRVARSFFRTGDVDFVGRLIHAAVRVPMDRFRLPGLLLRLAMQAAFLAVVSALLDALIGRRQWAGVAAVLLWMVVPGMIIGVFWISESILLFKSGRYLRTLFNRHFEESRLLPLAPGEGAERLNDPNIRKHTADLLDAGFHHLGDAISALNDGGDTLLRAFADPSRTAILVLSGIEQQNFGQEFLFQPNAIAFQVYTFFDDGGRFETASTSFGYRRQNPGPDSLIRFTPNADDPVKLCREHIAAAEAFARDRAKAIVPAGRFEDLLRRLAQIREEDRRQYQERGVSLADHLRRYLIWPRREIRG